MLNSSVRTSSLYGALAVASFLGGLLLLAPPTSRLHVSTALPTPAAAATTSTARPAPLAAPAAPHRLAPPTPALAAVRAQGSHDQRLARVPTSSSTVLPVWNFALLCLGFLAGWVLEGRRTPPPKAAAPLQAIVLATTTSERKAGAKPATVAPMRTRFAPSPTGSLHVGGARTALYNWLMAKKTGGQFLLRIEDTDMARSTRESEESMKADLRWLGLEWDEGPGTPLEAETPFRQSERGAIYLDMAQQLMAKRGPDGKPVAYKCFSSQEDVDALKEATAATGEFQGTFVSPWRDATEEEVAAKVAEGAPYAVRFRVPEGKRVAIDDVVRGPVSWDAQATIGDFVLLRSSGVPVYNFCVAVDDALMKVTHVIRAEEHLTNTLRQGLILEALGFAMPVYAHCSLILGEDGSKLSKRHGATSVAQFAEEGFVPSAMINYLVGLGWNDGTEKEVYTVEEVIQAFDIIRVNKSPSVFDMQKLRWINGQHLHAMGDSELAALLGPFLLKAGLCKTADSPLAVEAAHTCKLKLEVLADVVPLVQAALAWDLEATLAADPAAAELLEQDFKGLVAGIVASYDEGEFPDAAAEDFTAQYSAWVKAFGKKIGRKGKQLMQPVRLALTGVMSGPDVGGQLRLAALAAAEGVESVAPAARMAALRAFAAP